jgi:hypothetical protein
MSRLDPATAARLGRLRRFDTTGFYANESPTNGADSTGSITITIDATRRVVGVNGTRIDDALRTPQGLRTAVRGAYLAAMLAQIRASRALAGTAPHGRWTRPPQVALPQRDPNPVVFDDPIENGRTEIVTDYSAYYDESLNSSLKATGISDNTCVTVTLSRPDQSGVVDADPGWLRHAQPSNICNAVLQAFTDAYRKRD